MKPILALLVLTALASARAQQPPQNAPVPPPPPLAPEAIEKFVGAVQKAAADAAAIAASAVPAAVQNVEVQLQNLHSYAASSGASRGSRSLVIHSTEPDPLVTANTEEDLAIMARILRKAVGSSKDDLRRFASGIEVDGSVFGSASGARNIYLDGYGALFLLSVRYPLIAPAEKPEEIKPKDTTSDEWKDARDELQGARRGGGGYDHFVEAWNQNLGRAATAEDFDSDKVDNLKSSLLESLKNATHIRVLKPNDFVTVVVQGAEAIRVESVKRKPTTTALAKPSPAPADSDSKAAGAAPSKVVVKSSRSRSSLGETVMTIRVKKSDADAFAQGKLDLDTFRKKAAIQTYFRKTDSTSAAFFAPQVR